MAVSLLSDLDMVLGIGYKSGQHNLAAVAADDGKVEAAVGLVAKDAFVEAAVGQTGRKNHPAAWT